MKRWISFLLICGLCLSFGGCSQKSRSYEDDYEILVEEMRGLGDICSGVTYVTDLIWSNVGTDRFLNAYSSVLTFKSEDSLQELKDSYATKSSGQNEWVWVVALAGNAFGHDVSVVDDFKYDNSTGKMKDCPQTQKIMSDCIGFNECLAFLDEIDFIGERVRELKKQYSKTHPEEMALLNDWYIELSMYVDFAKNPSGSLSSYRSNDREYQDSISRYEKMAKNYAMSY